MKLKLALFYIDIGQHSQLLVPTSHLRNLKTKMGEKTLDPNSTGDFLEALVTPPPHPPNGGVVIYWPSRGVKGEFSGFVQPSRFSENGIYRAARYAAGSMPAMSFFPKYTANLA